MGGRRLVDRWGKYVFLTPERLDKAEEFFDRQGAKIITIARFIEGLRQANGIIAGITKMHWLRFIAYNALGAALWVGTWVSIGYFTASTSTRSTACHPVLAVRRDCGGGGDRRLDRAPRHAQAAAVRQAAAGSGGPPAAGGGSGPRWRFR